jgi:tetratricopeptide (TPR) repeat protein
MAHRPEGTLVLPAHSRGLGRAAERGGVSNAEHVLRSAERDLAAGNPEGAHRRVLSVSPREDLPPRMIAQLHFAAGKCLVSLGRLDAAERSFSLCETSLDSDGPADLSLLPCLLNRGCLLTQLGRCRSAMAVLRRARRLCDGTLCFDGSKVIAQKLALRSSILLALAAATLGGGNAAEAEAAVSAPDPARARPQHARHRIHSGILPRVGLLVPTPASSPAQHASYRSPRPAIAQYRDALTAAEAAERAASGSERRRAQPSRAVLSALLQARGEHREALKLLEMQRSALRDAHRRGEPNAAAELAHTAGRLAVSAYATSRSAVATTALREATGLALQLDPGGAKKGAKLEAWLADAEPLALARAARGGGVAI